jgi:hypothetical protein
VHPEIRRILSLPVGLPMTQEVAQQWSRFLCKDSAFSDPSFEGLRPMQAEALAAFYSGSGMATSLKVSGGKALIAWGCATIAASYLGVEKVLVVIPAKSHQNFMVKEQAKARKWLKAVPAVYDYRGVPRDQRLRMTRMPGIHVVTEGLVQGNGREILASIDPRAFIIDEIHNFTRKEAARAKRLLSFIKRMKMLGHKTYCAIMSASLGTAGIPRQWEFMYMALGELTPLPRDKETAALIEGEVDPSKTIGYVPGPGSAHLDALVNWCADNFSGFEREYTTRNRRLALQLRMRYTPGMIIDPSKPIRKPTIVHNVDCGMYNDAVAAVVDQVRRGITPSGDEMSSHLEQYRYMSQLTCGYYVELVWPSPDRLAVQRRCTPVEAEALLAQAKDLRDRENTYHKALRATLERISIDDEMDTPFRIGQMFQTALETRTKPRRFLELFRLWRDWKQFSEDHPELPERIQIPRLLDPYRINRAVQWARNGPGYLWVYHDALFHWTRKALIDAGIRHKVCDSGDAQAMKFLNMRRDPSYVYLIRLGGYGESIELDFLGRACYLEIVRNAKTMEQSLGRLDRTSQKSPYLDITIFSGNSFDLAQISAIIGTASKDAEVNGASHLLLQAVYDPPYQELTPAAQLAKMFRDYHAGDVDLQRVLQEMNDRQSGR